MTTTIEAVYERGLLRPLIPLPFAEGATVQVSVSSIPSPNGPPAISDEDILRRLEACTSLEDWFEITKLLPSDDGGYDIVAALQENRVWSNETTITE